MTTGVINAIFLYACIHVGRACFSSGVCGTGYGCTQPVAPVCSGGCAPGYTCGHYGCYSRARARSSKILADAAADNLQNDVAVIKRQEVNSEQAADELFYECCVDQRLPDSCLEKCSYSTYRKSALQAIYLRLDKCPLSALAAISYCAAGGLDHTECCMRNNVATTFAGNKCLTFCDQRPGNITHLDLSYLPCHEHFENIKACFMEHINNKSPTADLKIARTFEA